jgi:hypothetical protein
MRINFAEEIRGIKIIDGLNVRHAIQIRFGESMKTRDHPQTFALPRLRNFRQRNAERWIQFQSGRTRFVAETIERPQHDQGDDGRGSERSSQIARQRFSAIGRFPAGAPGMLDHFADRQNDQHGNQQHAGVL